MNTNAHNPKKRIAATAASLMVACSLAFGLTGCFGTGQRVISGTTQANAPNAMQVFTATARGKDVPSDARSATVLVYLNGSDLESEAGEASADISEMLKSGIGTNANVVIQTLGTRQWQDHGIASDHTQRHVVRHGKLELVDDSLGQLDTTSVDTLSDFIKWGVQNYPADRYMLVLWDHGAGPVYGFGYDEFQSDYSALTLDEIQTALKQNASTHFDIIGMDCCIMSSLETYSVLAPYCNYAILSEDFEPGIGWHYANWMSMLEKNPAIDSKQLGTTIVDDMINAVKASPENGDATLALVDESVVPELYKAWLEFAYENEDALLSSNYSQELSQHGHDGSRFTHGVSHGNTGAHGSPFGGLDGYGYGMDNGYNNSYGMGSTGFMDYMGMGDDYGIWDYWDNDASYVTTNDYFVTDIQSVASTVSSDKATALKNALKKAIVHYGCTSGDADMCGMGVTLPYGDAEFYDELVKVFSKCGFDKDYLDWLGKFVEAEGANDYYSDYGYDSLGDYSFDYVYDPLGSYSFHNVQGPQSVWGPVAHA